MKEYTHEAPPPTQVCMRLPTAIGFQFSLSRYVVCTPATRGPLLVCEARKPGSKHSTDTQHGRYAAGQTVQRRLCLKSIQQAYKTNQNHSLAVAPAHDGHSHTHTHLRKQRTRTMRSLTLAQTHSITRDSCSARMHWAWSMHTCQRSDESHRCHTHRYAPGPTQQGATAC